MTFRWKPTLAGIAAALLLNGFSFAAEECCESKCESIPAECELCDPCEDDEESCDFLNGLLLGDCFTERTGISIGGWVNGGVTINDNFSTLNGPLSFNDRQDFLMNQLYLSLGKSVDTDSNCMNFGFQVDVMYGTDAQFTQALGLDEDIISGADTNSGIYRMAIPQAYTEIFVPVAKGLSIKAGHFYTIIGYEVVTAPDNFFYSHAYTMQYGEPFTHSGVLSSLSISDSVTLHNGIVRGWDSWHDNNNGVSYLGGVTVDVSDSTSLAFTLVHGAEQDEPRAAWQGIAGVANETLDRTMYSFVLTQKLGDKLTYVFQHDLGNQVGSGRAGVPGAEWYGINQYLLYDLTDKLSVGTRMEWFRDDDGFRVSGVRTGNPGVAANYYGLTLGANYRPHSCLTIRPEVRWDLQRRDSGASAPAFAQPAAGMPGTEDNQFTVAMDVILKF